MCFAVIIGFLMNLPSPYSGLNVDKDLICDFFATFSRIEYSLKVLGFVRVDRRIVSPARRRFASEMDGVISVDNESILEKAISYMCEDPPLVQVDATRWEPEELYGDGKVARSIDATCRVRHNLFHGGKFYPEKRPGRDQELVLAAYTILCGCLEYSPELLDVYLKNKDAI